MHVPNQFEKEGVKYLNVKIDDTPKYKISPFFREVYDFMEKALTYDDQGEEWNSDHSFNLELVNFKNLNEKDINTLLEQIPSWTYKNKILQLLFKKQYKKSNNSNRILIHCSLGISRSPTLAIMYIMRKFKLGFEQAYEFLKFQRYAISPILSFICELEEFEKNDFKFYDEI
jgi:protein-tyrosine phosphatase